MAANDNDNDDAPNDIAMTPTTSQERTSIPSSPPPSFRSRTSSVASRHLLQSEDPITTDAERALNDAFDNGSDSDEEGDNEGDDRQRLIRSATSQSLAGSRPAQDGGRPDLLRSFTRFPGRQPDGNNASDPPAPAPTQPSSYGRSNGNDGVFANLNAKPERGEKLEEQPPVSLSALILINPI